MWLEGRVYIEYLRLIRDPVYRGDDVPPGLGRPVLLIPGFLAGDWTLRTPFQWLRRVGYRPRMAGVAFNVMYSEVMLRPLIDSLQHAPARTGARVVAGRPQPRRRARQGAVASQAGAGRAGHHAGLAAQRSIRRAPADDGRRAGGAPLQRRFATAIRRRWRCASCATSPRRHACRRPRIYSRSDGVVNWRACLRPDVNAIEVNGSHIGLALNPEVYRILAHLLPAPWRQRSRGKIGS